MSYSPLEDGVIALLLDDAGVSGVASNRIFPVVVPQGQLRPAVTVARVRTERESETIETDRTPIATLEIRSIASTYQAAAELAKLCRVCLQTVPSTLGDHDVAQADVDDEIDEFEPDTSERGGTGYYHRVLKYVVEYYE